MVHTGIYATASECVYKAGANYNAVSISTSQINEFCAQVESEINVYCTHIFANTAAEFTALPSATKQALSLVASNKVAIYMIQYDMSGFTTRTEAEDMLIILNVQSKKALASLKEKEGQDMVTGVRT